jgi:putative aldouronate transport system permease protein
MVGLLKTLIGMEGPVNSALVNLGLTSKRIGFLTIPGYFRPIAVLSDLWKGIGWGSILYLAAISSISQDMYEAAYIDGANRFQRVLHITLPSMMPTVTIMLIFSVAGILGSNFDQHLLLNNAQISKVASTIDTYVYGVGLQTGRYSYATAINLTRSVIGFFLLFGADRLARFLTDGEQGLF